MYRKTDEYEVTVEAVERQAGQQQQQVIKAYFILKAVSRQ